MPPTPKGCASATRMCSAAAVSQPCSKSGSSMTNSSPDSRPTMSVARASRRSRSATLAQQRVADGMPQRVVDLLEAVQVRNNTATRLRSASARAMACSDWASNRLRLGSPVNSS